MGELPQREGPRHETDAGESPTPPFPHSPNPDGPRLGEWLSEAIALFGKQWPVWIACGAITFGAVAPFFIGSVSYLFYVLYREYSAANTGFETNAALGQQAIYSALNGVFLAFVPIIVFSAILSTGMARTAAKQMRGEPIGVAELFRGGATYLPGLGAVLLSVLASGLCVAFAIVPAILWAQGVSPAALTGIAFGLLLLAPVGIVLTGRLLLVHPLVTEQRAGLVTAVRMSWDLTRRHFLSYLAWALLVYLLPSVGVLLFGVGMMVSVPLSVLMLMVAYRDASDVRSIPSRGAAD